MRGRDAVPLLKQQSAEEDDMMMREKVLKVNLFVCVLCGGVFFKTKLRTSLIRTTHFCQLRYFLDFALSSSRARTFNKNVYL